MTDVYLLRCNERGKECWITGGILEMQAGQFPHLKKSSASSSKSLNFFPYDSEEVNLFYFPLHFFSFHSPVGCLFLDGRDVILRTYAILYDVVDSVYGSNLFLVESLPSVKTGGAFRLTCYLVFGSSLSVFGTCLGKGR